jgi:hypothetical protein
MGAKKKKVTRKGKKERKGHVSSKKYASIPLRVVLLSELFIVLAAARACSWLTTRIVMCAASAVTLRLNRF